ncbi:MAG: OprO/OprP family phosphate-selective porin [Myxococcales bacterium]
MTLLLAILLAQTDGLHLGALVQADGRFYAGNAAPPSTFLMRRIRPFFDGASGELIRVRVDIDFGEGKVVVYDAFVDLRLRDWFTLRAGRFATSIGLEQLRYPGSLTFIERGFPSLLVPNRDVGVEARGRLFDGVVRYAAGAFNGVADGQIGDVDTNGSKDFDARVMLYPWPTFGLGIAGSTGVQRGSVATPQLPVFKSMGQVSFFAYSPTAYANGRHDRLAPQLFWTQGPFSALGEWTISRQEVVDGSVNVRLVHRARQLALAYVLTGEPAAWDGIAPARRWGAFEVAARYNDLEVDPSTFPGCADPAKSPRSARAVGLGLNWYLSTHARFGVNLERTAFEGAGRAVENAVFTRLQGTL